MTNQLNFNIKLNGEEITWQQAKEILEGYEKAMTGKGKAAARTSAADKDKFEEFWSVVHLKVGKQSARKAWSQAIKHKRATADQMIEAMTVFAKSDQAKPKDHTPIHPATWITSGRYEDDRTTWGLPVERGPKKKTYREAIDYWRNRLVKDFNCPDARDWDDKTIHRVWIKKMEPTNS